MAEAVTTAAATTTTQRNQVNQVSSNMYFLISKTSLNAYIDVVVVPVDVAVIADAVVVGSDISLATFSSSPGTSSTLVERISSERQ